MARPLYELLLQTQTQTQTRTRVLGPDHPDTLRPRRAMERFSEEDGEALPDGSLWGR